ncbi:hypothetical protein [Desertivirga xinjiangensis]|uniref:hypothetical protein n=1 Tax=Desertivirga xinjiangensis TaxID=539206 RepID=UPI00210A5F7A|nr:hypothetical protein [Pedobacter xinjiangensis]
MKSNIYLPLLLLCFLGASCEKNAPDEWLKDNIEIVGKLPVIASLSVVPPQTSRVPAGSSLQLDLRYWSDDPVDKINLYATVGTGARQAVSTSAYAKAYSAVSRTDSLLLPYQVPAGLASGTSIKLDVEVLNQNTLSRTSSVTLTVQ